MANSNPFESYTLRKLDKVLQHRWLIENFIPEHGTCIAYGPPASFKSFLALDMGLHITNGMNWHDNQLHKPGLVIYLVGEGLHGISKRSKTWHDYHKIPDTSAFITIPFQHLVIHSEENMKYLVSKIQDLETKYNTKTSLIIIDTLARAMVGVEENSTRDTSLFINKFDVVKKKLDCALLYIHHCGKDMTRGMRGSSALLAAVDVAIGIEYNYRHVNIVTIKQKDAEQVSRTLFVHKHADSIVLISNRLE